jgi:alpha-tubulin suppressor-like RCC1 family protein
VAGSVVGNADGVGTAAKFNDPRGLAMNGRGELFVADSGNHSIRRISPDGAVRTIAGGSASGAYLDGAGADVRFNSPRGIAFGGDGLLYITDLGNHRIRRMEVTQPLITGAPASMAAFTADFGSASTAQTFAFAGNGLEGPITVTAPSGFEVSTDGSSYATSVTSNEGATLYIRLAATGSLTGNLTLTSAQADTINIALSGQVAAVLEPSVDTLTGFSSTVGGTSAAQSFSLTGGGFSDLVKVTAPAGYEISTDGLSFASAVTLGQQPTGSIQSVLLDAAGQNTVATGAIFYTGSGSQFPNTGAFAALKSDGSVVTWGNHRNGGDFSVTSRDPETNQIIYTPASGNITSNVTALYSNEVAFAALKNDGSVVTWGNMQRGGDFAVYLIVETQERTFDIFRTPAVGNITSNVTAVSSTKEAFAALKSNGSVVTWGNSDSGADSSSVAASLSSEVTAVYSNYYAFAALKSDGSVVTWGNSDLGGNSSSVAASLGSEVTAVYSNATAFAALKSDGSVVTWGNSNGGNSSSVAASLSSGVVKVYSSTGAFAALKSDGSVVTWGYSLWGGDSSSVAASLGSEVTAVYSTGYAFAALKSDGSVVTWGSSDFGGNSSSVAASLSSDVTAVYSNQSAFAALKNDGSVVTWGAVSSDVNFSSVAASLSSGVVKVYATAGAFAALKSDGSVVTWGASDRGGNSSSVAASLGSEVIAVYSNYYAFAALKSDGSVVTWGEAGNGGSGGPANIGGPLPPTLPLTLHVRLAATAPLGAVAGNLTISTTDATTQTVALSGTVSATQTYTHQQLWRFANFGGYSSENSGADAADPDGDGLSNLLEYALGLDPNASGTFPASLALNGANLEYTYSRSIAAKDNGVAYQIEWSDTLDVGSWSVETVTEQITSTEGALETVKASIPAGTGAKRFLRLRVTAVTNN